MKEVPIQDKPFLTLEEGAAYFGIGINKLRAMTDQKNSPYVIWNGNKRLIKKVAFEKYLDSAFSI